MALENLKIENNETLDAIVDEIGKLESEIKSKKDSGEAAKDIINSLNKEQLTNYIEHSLKEGDDWLTYQDMQNQTFYPFIVQATIDLLSEELKSEGQTNKYDEDGNIDNDNGKTLDEWISEFGGIDNIYGNGTKQIVKIIQHIYGIHEDGLAGPQFFAKVCSVLNGKDSVTDFKVKGFDEEHPYKYGFENPSISTDTETSSTENETILEDGTHTMKLRHGLYEVTLPKDFTLSQKEGDEDQYLLNYKGYYMGFIQLRNGIASLYYGFNMKKNICNFRQRINNKSVPHTIECLLNNKEKTEFYGKTFVMDYGIGYTKPDGQHSLNFLNQYGTYGGRFLIINEKSGEPELLNGFSQTEYKELMKIKMEKDENDPNTYYINWA